MTSDKNQQAGLINESGGPQVLKIFALLCVIGSVVGGVLNIVTHSFYGTSPFLFAIGVTTILLLRAGLSRLAALIFVWGMLLAISFGAWLGGGLYNSSWIIMPMAIMLIGWMLGLRSAIMLTCATVMVIGLLLWLHLTGYAFRSPSKPTIFATVIILSGVIAAIIGSITASIYQKQLLQVRELHSQLLQDIVKRKEYENTLEQIAHYDVLTKLPNRTLLADRLRQAMTQSQRRGRQVAVAFVDLDGFKAINDKYGHTIGDQLLVTLAGRMKQALRDVDTLARFGGDEFIAVLLDLDNSASCVPLLNRLLDAASTPIQLSDNLIQISASIGVTLYPQTNDMEADQLLRQADQAMYQAKLSGKGRYHFFDAIQDRTIRVHHESLERIRLALEKGEFVLYYQPKVNMRHGYVVGVEALIRWQHPDVGILMPAEFLPVIEDHPLSVAVGEWVIEAALNQVEQWHTNGIDLPISVNIGARQLQQTDFVESLKFVLSRHPNVRPSSLELEVLETSALADMAQVSQVIEDCSLIGVKFALDDFGTGYSSLTYLKLLRVALLKIDQSFVRDMLEDPDDLAILEGVVGLAAAFRRDVIAEGMETVAHGTALLHLGCELAQGYGIARPMPAELIPSWIATWKPYEEWGAVPQRGAKASVF